MKIRTLLAAGALVAGVASSFAAAPALAWECPDNITNTLWIYHPLTGERWTKVCTPDLNCEQCFADVR